MANFDIEGRRARRRRVSLTIARRRREEHIALVHRDRSTGITNVACICELADTYFSKRSAHGCGCRKRTKGRPKVACGMCDIGARDRIIHWRQEARALRVDVRAGRLCEEVEHVPSLAKGDPSEPIDR